MPNADRWVYPTEVPAHVCLLGIPQEGRTGWGLAVDLVTSGVTASHSGPLLGDGGELPSNLWWEL